MTSLLRLPMAIAFGCCVVLGVASHVDAQEPFQLQVDLTNPGFAKEGWTPWSCNCAGGNSCIEEGPDGVRLIDPNTLTCEVDDILQFCTGDCAFDDDRHDPRTGIFFTPDEQRIALYITPLEREGGFGGGFNRGGTGPDPGEYPDEQDVQARGDDSLARDLWTVTGSNNLQGQIRFRFLELPAGTYALQTFHHDPDPEWNTAGNLPGVPRDNVVAVNVGGNVLESTGAANVPQHTALTDEELVATGGSVVTFTTDGASSDNGDSRIEIDFINEQGDGISINGFILTGTTCSGGAGDTHLGGIQVTAPQAGNVPGAYTVEATGAVDDSGDAIFYQYSATNGTDTVELTSAQASVELAIPSAGTWTFSATADDLCPTLAGDASASAEVEITCPLDGDTTCDGLQIVGPEDNALGQYLITASGTDAGGDDIIYTLTASRTGLDSPIVQTQVGVGAFQVLLSAGTWTVQVETDDDSCTDLAGVCTSAPFEVIAPDADFPDAPILADILFRRAEPNFELQQPGWEAFIPIGRGGPATTNVIDNVAFTTGYANSNLNNASVRTDGGARFLVMQDYYQPDNIFGAPDADIIVNINFLQPGTYKLQTFHPRNHSAFITSAEGDVSDTDAGKIYFHSNSNEGFNDPDYLDAIGLPPDATQEEINEVDITEDDFFFFGTIPGGTDSDGDGIMDTIPESWKPENGGGFPADKTIDDVQAAFDANNVGRAEVTFTTTGTGEARFRYRIFDAGNRCELAGFALHAVSVGEEVSIVPGDSNLDGGVDLSDPVNTLNYLFQGGVLDDCLLVSGTSSLNNTGTLILDWNGDGGVDLSDPVAGLNGLFQGGPGHVLGAACTDFTGSSCSTPSGCR